MNKMNKDIAKLFTIDYTYCRKDRMNKWSCIGGFDSFEHAHDYSNKQNEEDCETRVLAVPNMFSNKIKEHMLAAQLKPYVSYKN